MHITINLKKTNVIIQGVAQWEASLSILKPSMTKPIRALIAGASRKDAYNKVQEFLATVLGLDLET